MKLDKYDGIYGIRWKVRSSSGMGLYLLMDIVCCKILWWLANWKERNMDRKKLYFSTQRNSINDQLHILVSLGDEINHSRSMYLWCYKQQCVSWVQWTMLICGDMQSAVCLHTWTSEPIAIAVLLHLVGHRSWSAGLPFDDGGTDAVWRIDRTPGVLFPMDMLKIHVTSSWSSHIRSFPEKCATSLQGHGDIDTWLAWGMLSEFGSIWPWMIGWSRQVLQ